MRHNSLPFLILNHPIIIFPLNENPWPWSQKVNCGPIMPGHILFLTALPPSTPPTMTCLLPCHLSLYFCCSSTDVARKRSNFFCFWKQAVLGMITKGSLVDWISQDVGSCRNFTASRVYKEDKRDYISLASELEQSHYIGGSWERRRSREFKRKERVGEKQSTRSVDKAIGVRRQETTRTPTLR